MNLEKILWEIVKDVAVTGYGDTITDTIIVDGDLDIKKAEAVISQAIQEERHRLNEIIEKLEKDFDKVCQTSYDKVTGKVMAIAYKEALSDLKQELGVKDV